MLLLFRGLEPCRQTVQVCSQRGYFVAAGDVDSGPVVSRRKGMNSGGDSAYSGDHGRRYPKTEEDRHDGTEDEERHEELEVVRGRDKHQLRDNEHVEKGHAIADNNAQECFRLYRQADNSVGEA